MINSTVFRETDRRRGCCSVRAENGRIDGILLAIIRSPGRSPISSTVQETGYSSLAQAGVLKTLFSGANVYVVRPAEGFVNRNILVAMPVFPGRGTSPHQGKSNQFKPNLTASRAIKYGNVLLTYQKP
ncbi:MAG: hypothetical protein GYA12_05260 [Chloroflexi bacterium]|nr:hypothetical protein [Chloroflexota bacterium]